MTLFWSIDYTAQSRWDIFHASKSALHCSIARHVYLNRQYVPHLMAKRKESRPPFVWHCWVRQTSVDVECETLSCLRYYAKLFCNAGAKLHFDFNSTSFLSQCIDALSFLWHSRVSFWYLNSRVGTQTVMYLTPSTRWKVQNVHYSEFSLNGPYWVCS